jgi:ABC-type multidrug transport system ATPase subunit
MIATHDLDLAEGLFDRAFVLRDGRAIALDGEPRPWRDRYREAVDVRPVRG